MRGMGEGGAPSGSRRSPPCRLAGEIRIGVAFYLPLARAIVRLAALATAFREAVTMSLSRPTP
jgi:hypothetical protein